MADNNGKKNRHVNPYLPDRPKKVITGYGLFIREYWERNNPGGGAQAREAFSVAGVEWRNLTPARRNEYNARCAEDRNRYLTEMIAWKAQRKALKRPASAYGLFLKEIWERERNSGRDVGEMGRFAAVLWRDMDDDAKQEYHDLYAEQTVRYKAVMQTVANGGEIVDWRAEQPAVPDPNSDNEDEDNDDNY